MPDLFSKAQRSRENKGHQKCINLFLFDLRLSRCIFYIQIRSFGIYSLFSLPSSFSSVSSILLLAILLLYVNSLVVLSEEFPSDETKLASLSTIHAEQPWRLGYHQTAFIYNFAKNSSPLQGSFGPCMPKVQSKSANEFLRDKRFKTQSKTSYN